MLKFCAISCVLVLLTYVNAGNIADMTSDQLILESQTCGESNFHEGNCMLKSNCVFMHWRVKALGEVLRLCMSYNEIMKYYVKDPARYLKSTKIKSHKTINKANFCDVMDDSDKFMEYEGKIERCIVSTV